jgi:polysaccharide transporter, PST family
MKPFDDSGAFRPIADGTRLRSLAVRGAGVTVAAQASGLIVQMAATVTLARLVAPAEFGLVAVVTTFSLLFMNFGFNGFTEAVVQRENVDRGLCSNLFWINLGIGLSLTIAFAASGPLLARVYGDARLSGVAIALSATILLTSLSVLHLSLLKRAMRFPALSANDVLARAASVVVAIALAWAGFGYWALIAGAIALPLATCVGAWTLCLWLPGPPRRRAGTGEMVRFALNTYGHFAANYCTRNLDNLLVGWFFGPQALGFYKKAYDLSVLPVGQLSGPTHAVAVPVLSRLAGNPERQRRYVLGALSILAFVGMGLGAALALIGQDLIYILLGSRWAISGKIFAFFAPGIGAMLLYLAYGWVHLSIGRADRLLRWGLIELAVFGSMFAAAIPWGPVGVATAWVVASWVLVIPALRYAGGPAGLGVGSIVGAIWRYVAASAAAATASAAIVARIPALTAASGQIASLDRIAIATLTFSILYLGAVVLLHGGFAPIRQLVSVLPDLMPARRLGARSADASVSAA